MLLSEATLFDPEKQYLYCVKMDDQSNLTPEQRADAGRLTSIFRKWKAGQRANGHLVTQDTAAHDLGISQSAFSQYCRGIRPLNATILEKMRWAFGWDPAEISPSLARSMAALGAAVGATEADDHAPIRLVDARASAGKGEIVMSEDVTKVLMFRRDWLAKNNAKPSQTIAFEVRGDSMVDMHIIDRSVVLVDRQIRWPMDGRIFVLWINGELFVKQVAFADGEWWIRSHNARRKDRYPDIIVNDPEAMIVGRVFWCGFGL